LPFPYIAAGSLGVGRRNAYERKGLSPIENSGWGIVDIFLHEELIDSAAL